MRRERPAAVADDGLDDADRDLQAGAASGALPPRGFSAGMASDIRGLAEVNEACLVRLPNWEITFLPGGPGDADRHDGSSR